MFHIITSIVIVLFTSYLPTVDNKTWTRRPGSTYPRPFIQPTTISDYYDEVYGHINVGHYYDSDEDHIKKYEDAKKRILGWKRMYASVRIQYQNLSTHHQNLSVNYENLSTHYQNLRVNYQNLSAHHQNLSERYKHVQNHVDRLLLDKECADFFREYIPKIERDYIQHKQGFTADFKKCNPFFFTEYYDLDSYTDKIYRVYQILKLVGLKFDNRSSCSFKYMSAKEYYDPLVPIEIENMIKDKKSNLNKCEQWIFFLHAVRKERSPSRSTEIKMWQTLIEHYEERTRNPYPVMVQNILHALYWSHQYHHGVEPNKSTETGNEENCSSTQYKLEPKMVLHCMYRGILAWQDQNYVTYIVKTSPWTTPIFQGYLKGEIPTTEIDPDSLATSANATIATINFFGIIKRKPTTNMNNTITN
ncbi:uncharacterized protein LOC135847766 [Planococcus citri]|uniref:uncharacterized protein LOC135847766 n=1 Tax=Planococcus citri TaxID=170843 RepID=UPI0031F89653